MQLKCGDKYLDLTTPQLMAVVNITPDSFFDGGQLFAGGRPDLNLICQKAEQCIQEGADVLDVGGESTRPGAVPVSIEEELGRVVPVVEALHQRFDVPVSVDTSSPEVMVEVAKVGANMINDVRALSRPGAVAAAKSVDLPICLMHMQGSPQTMQNAPAYSDAVQEVYAYLSERVECLLAEGISREQIVVDPGIGFGKTDEHNLALIKKLDVFSSLGPVLLGVSRKSMFGRLLGRDLADRLPGSLAVAVIGMQRGAKILRVHDVAATRDAIIMYKLTK